MKKRKIIFLTIACTMLTSLVGCQKINIRSPEKTEQTTEFFSARETESITQPIINISSKDKSKPKKFKYLNIEETPKELTVESYDGSCKFLVIPDESNGLPVTGITGSAFFGSKAGFKYVILGKNIKEIGKNAFCQQKNLKYINFNDCLENIDDAVFLSTGLKGTIVIPNSVKYIGNGAFADTKIENIIVGSGVKKISAVAFSVGPILKTVTFTSMNIEFDDDNKKDGNIFYGCPNLTIIAPIGSTAEKYAKKHNISFKEL